MESVIVPRSDVVADCEKTNALRVITDAIRTANCDSRERMEPLLPLRAAIRIMFCPSNVDRKDS